MSLPIISLVLDVPAGLLIVGGHMAAGVRATQDALGPRRVAAERASRVPAAPDGSAGLDEPERLMGFRDHEQGRPQCDIPESDSGAVPGRVCIVGCDAPGQRERLHLVSAQL